MYSISTYEFTTKAADEDYKDGDDDDDRWVTHVSLPKLGSLPLWWSYDQRQAGEEKDKPHDTILLIAESGQQGRNLGAGMDGCCSP